MQHPRSRQGDLFEPRKRPRELRPEHRAKLLMLLEALLTEALSAPPPEDSGRNPEEGREPRDHG